MQSASKDSTVKVLRGAFDLQEEVAHSPQAVSEAGLVLAQPVVVRDANIVDLLHELGVLPSHQHLVQALTAALLHPLEAELEVDRHFFANLAISLECMDPSKHWSLVISRSTSIQLPVLLSEHPRISVPPVLLLVGRLHIQVAVDQQGLLCRVLTQLAHQDRWQLKNLTV